MRKYFPGTEITFVPSVEILGYTPSPICEYTWTFDDGEIQYGAIAKKIWNDEGIHTAICKAVNTENGWSGEGEVKVYVKNVFDFTFDLSAEYKSELDSFFVSVELHPSYPGLAFAVVPEWNG